MKTMPEDFEIIYEKDKVFGDYLKCKHCGERVERGIVTVSHHLMHCLKRTDDLVVANNDFEKRILDSWSVSKHENE